MRLGQAPSTTTAEFIAENKVGIRVGTSPQGACYSLTDLLGNGKNDIGNHMQQAAAIRQWAANPSNASYDPKWSTRLWNTCTMMKNSADSGDKIWFLKQALPTGERYNVGFDQNPQYTFTKNNNARQALQGAQTIQVYGREVQEIYDDVRGELTRLAGG